MWADATYGVVPRETLIGTAGLAFLQGIIDGQHPNPPFAGATRIRLHRVAEGLAVFTGEPTEGFLNPLGTIHGGWSAAILDSAMACAVHTTLEAGEGYATIELKVNLVRPLQPDAGEVTCEGVIIHRGSSIATAEGRLVDVNGRLLAHGTETCLIVRAPKGRAAHDLAEGGRPDGRSASAGRRGPRL